MRVSIGAWNQKAKSRRGLGRREQCEYGSPATGEAEAGIRRRFGTAVKSAPAPLPIGPCAYSPDVTISDLCVSHR